MFVRHVGGSKSCALPYYYAEDGPPDWLQWAAGPDRIAGPSAPLENVNAIVARRGLDQYDARP